MSQTTNSNNNQTSKIKSAGNIAGWLISVLSGIFTLFEILVPKGESMSSLGLSSDLNYLIGGVLGIWYIRYGIAAIFVSLLLFFVFPREEERVKKRRRRRKKSR